MSRFTVHSVESAPEGSKEMLAGTSARLGRVPNLHGVLAESPAALAAYYSMAKIFGELSAFTPVEQQVVLLSLNYENGCTYCMAGHSVLAKAAGMDDATLEALRSATPLPDAKQNALSRFARLMVQQAGWIGDDETDAFIAAGWTKQHVLDVVAGAAYKTLSYYTNHLADTPLDESFVPHAWTADHVD